MATAAPRGMRSGPCSCLCVCPPLSVAPHQPGYPITDQHRPQYTTSLLSYSSSSCPSFQARPESLLAAPLCCLPQEFPASKKELLCSCSRAAPQNTSAAGQTQLLQGHTNTPAPAWPHRAARSRTPSSSSSNSSCHRSRSTTCALQQTCSQGSHGAAPRAAGVSDCGCGGPLQLLCRPGGTAAAAATDHGLPGVRHGACACVCGDMLGAEVS